VHACHQTFVLIGCVTGCAVAAALRMGVPPAPAAAA
jgi:hypothetical protein